MGKVLTAAPEAFGAAAAGYDREFEPFAGPLREVMLGTMLRVFPPGARILDLNCGTGTDAIALASRGYRVTAIDGSAAMIGVLQGKLAALAAAGTRAAVDPRLVAFDDLDALVPGAGYGGALSNFGGLNCARDIPAVLRSLARLLAPGAPFVACVMNRFCLWEAAAYAARFRFTDALRRLRRGDTTARVAGTDIAVRYYSAGELARLMRPFFAVDEVFGLSILSPPPASRDFIARHPGLVRRLERCDAAIRRMPPARSLGDHVVLVGRRR